MAQSFHYLDYDYGITLPRLVLVCNDSSLPMKAEGPRWLYIAHQTAGHACNQHQFLGTILEPTDEVAQAMYALDKKWEGSCVGMYETTLDDMISYRQDLKELFGAGIDCNFSCHEFEEGLYPIDYTPQSLRKLSQDQLPKELDELVDWEQFSGNKALQQAFGAFNRWKLFILGRNCD